MYKKPDEVVEMTVDFVNELPVGGTLQPGSAVEVFDSNGTDVTSSMLVAIHINATSLDAVVQGGTDGKNYHAHFIGNGVSPLVYIDDLYFSVRSTFTPARWDTIIEDVLENLSDEGVRDANMDRVTAEADKVQVDICREALALQSASSIVTVATQSEYPINALWYRIVQIFKPSAWTRDIIIVHDKEDWKKIINNTNLPTQQPLFATVWNKSFILWPAPTEVQTLTVWFNARPSNPAELGSDPDIEEQWDDCLTYGITARMFRKKLARSPNLSGIYTLYDGLYRSELTRQSQHELKRMVLGPNKVASSSDRIGF